MAHESFENPRIAELMNDNFVNIKVDREERPDLDQVYQTCFQLMHQRGGGWPLTVFLDPHNHIPFYTATYIPDKPRHGMAGFDQILDSVSEFYRERRGDVRSMEQQFRDVFQRLERRTPATEWDLNIIDKAVHQALGEYDPKHGGFRGAPKFPLPYQLQLLWWRGGRKGRDAVRHSLARMIRGGSFDQVGGGLFRYSVDERWEIPHFEKMLYDNGPLLTLLAPLAEEPEFARAARAVADWLLREMRTPEGAFYAAVDADSEGREGLFYLWTPDEIATILGPGSEALALLRHWLNLDKPANFEGRWHLHQTRPLVEAANAVGLPFERAAQVADAALTRLHRAREERVFPFTDIKILTSWNALAVTGLLDIAEALNEPAYGEAALLALDFIQQRLWRNDSLYASWQWREDGTGEPRYAGYLDDYAFLAAALYRALAWRWDNDRAAWLQAILTQLLARFDEGDNGFRFTDRASPPLILKQRTFIDNVVPAGNAVAALTLTRAGHLFAVGDWLAAAERPVRAGWEDALRQPSATFHLLRAADEITSPPPLVLVQGPDREDWRRILQPENPACHLFALPPAVSLPMATARRENSATVCIGHQCTGPYRTLDELRAALRDITDATKA